MIQLSSTNRTYDVPANETQRLRRLHEYGILDSSAEPAFDNLTELASNVFDVPIALICLIDEDRQWFKSNKGLTISETKRHCAFCNHVLLDESIVTIEDTLDDPRLEDDPPLLDLVDVRSYMGAPLRTDDGYILGTFCLLDYKPRTYTAVERNILNRLSRVVMSQIDLRYENSERKRLNQELQQELKTLYERVENQELAQEELIHRTKNSFQQVRSLLSIRKRDVGNEDHYRALEMAETKLHAFMTLYDQLSLARNHETVAVDEYLGSLVENVRDVFEEGFANVTVDLDLPATRFEAEVAAKFGIALNELVSNAYQHVFQPGTGSHLSIVFRVQDGEYVLTVRDDGPGVPDDETKRNHGGLKLIRDLIEHDGDGTLRYDDSDGTTFTIRVSQPE